VAKKGGRKDGDWATKLNLGAGSWSRSNQIKDERNISIENSNSQLTYDEPDDVKNNLSPEQIKDLLAEMNDAMKKAALELDFEEAAKLRDRIFELENLL
ncbi:MAG: hypothetical protein CMA81_07815, partial [Euryarchaeota archaeon]|nr:hypothetical protein [Euryarchaeota archaeon]